MLAGIFMVRLEATARVSRETLRPSNSPFVPFSGSSQIRSKHGVDRLVETVREKASQVAAMRWYAFGSDQKQMPRQLPLAGRILGTLRPAVRPPSSNPWTLGKRPFCWP
jgi:hypothetical protein